MKKIVLWLCGLLFLGILAGYGVGWFVQQSREPVERIPIVVEPEQPPREVLVYFPDPQGQLLVPEMREIAGCDEDSECIRSLVEVMRSGSLQENLPLLPPAVNVRSVEVENDLVRIDFSRQLVDGHPGGSLSELFTVYGLINSLRENFPYLRQLQILVEGKVLPTLKGHVRIDQPIYADFSYSRPPLQAPGVGGEGETAEKDKQDE